MTREELADQLVHAFERLLAVDSDLLMRANSERCLAARIAHHLQNGIDQTPGLGNWAVDVEFNRQGAGQDPKLLGLPEECAKYVTPAGQAYVTPDIIIHRRGAAGPQLFVAEVKKTGNRASRDCDRRRIEAFCASFHYRYGALVELETRSGRSLDARLVWYTNRIWEAPVSLAANRNRVIP